METIIQQEVPEARLVVADYGDKEGVEGADNPRWYRGTIRVRIGGQKERKRGQFEITQSLLASLEQVPGVQIKELIINPLSPDGENGLIVQILAMIQNSKRTNQWGKGTLR